MTDGEIKKIVFVGGGTMGSFNSMVAAAAGYQVTVFDDSVEALAALPDRQKAFGEILIENWQMPRERIDLGLKGIYLTNDPAEAAAGEFFRPYLQRGELGQKTGKGFYSYPDPAFSQPEFLEGKTENPLASKALINAVLATALTLVIEGAGDIRDVDRSWMITHRPDIGPLGMIDEKGLDVFLREMEERAALNPLFAPNLPSISDYLKGYIDKGELGVKTGKGFYTSPDPEFKNPDFLLGAE
jgi:3-hydroxyacyl-CoA dehydrogenase